MPSLVIHMAIAKSYFNKHKYQIKNEEEFIKGSIAPDLDETKTQTCKDKSKSHYGRWNVFPVETNIDKFLNDSIVHIEHDYWKGYLLHLLTDYYFYNYIFKDEFLKSKYNNDNFYYDYDCLNSKLIYKYNIPLYKNIEKYMICVNGTPKYIDINKLMNFINRISDLNLDCQIKTIYEKGMEGLINEYKN